MRTFSYVIIALEVAVAILMYATKQYVMGAVWLILAGHELSLARRQ